MSYGTLHDLAAQLQVKHAIAEINATAAGAGDATEVDGTTISIIPADMPKRPIAVAFLVWMRAALGAAESLALEYTLQYRTGASTWNDVTVANGCREDRANIDLGNLLTSAAGDTQTGAVAIGLDLTQLPTSANAVRIQLKPDLSRGATDTATLTAIAAFNSMELPA